MAATRAQPLRMRLCKRNELIQRFIATYLSVILAQISNFLHLFYLIHSYYIKQAPL